jgi:hypothetical protein
VLVYNNNKIVIEKKKGVVVVVRGFRERRQKPPRVAVMVSYGMVDTYIHVYTQLWINVFRIPKNQQWTGYKRG